MCEPSRVPNRFARTRRFSVDAHLLVDVLHGLVRAPGRKRTPKCDASRWTLIPNLRIDVDTAKRKDGFEIAKTDFAVPEEDHCCRLEISIRRSSSKASTTTAVDSPMAFDAAVGAPMKCTALSSTEKTNGYKARSPCLVRHVSRVAAHTHRPRRVYADVHP